MTRSKGNDTPVLVKAVAFIAAIAICVCTITAIAATVKITRMTKPVKTTEQAQEAQPTEASGGSSTPAPATQAPAPETQAPADGGGDAAPADNGGEAAAPAASAGTTDPAEVLKTYTDIMNKVKTDGKSVTEFGYNTLGDYDLGAATNIIGPVLKNMLTLEDAAEESVKTDMRADFPIKNNDKGCLLTDTAGIQSCSIVDNGDGTSTLTIVTKAEDNAEPAPDGGSASPSYTGGIFAPMSAAGVDETVASIPAVNINNLIINYHDCTATVKYKTDTLEAIDVLLDMPFKLTAEVKVTFVSLNAVANLGWTDHFYNFEY